VAFAACEFRRAGSVIRTVIGAFNDVEGCTMSETIAGIKIPAVLNELLILTQSSVFGFSHGLGPQLPRMCETARPQLARNDMPMQSPHVRC
jgi:hypothetical protein